MDIFSSLMEQLSKESESIKTTQSNYAPAFYTIEYQLSTIVDKINNIESLNEDEIKNIIYRQHNMILNYDLFLKSHESRITAQRLFTNKRFLQIFLNISGLLQLSNDEIICVNKLAYDYYIIKDKDPEVSDLLLQISYQLNSSLVLRLSAKIGINGAKVLSMIANSSFKLEKNVHRINTFLIKCNLALSVQDIIDIYSILFNRFSFPFVYIMLEYKTQYMTKEQCLKFDMISVAILEILNSMTTEDMKKILLNYGYMLKLVNTPVRFALKTAKQYPRIINAISEVESDDFENIIIP